jgi:hypothetical protein
MFIHVPELGKPYSDKELADGILEIIRCAIALKQYFKSSV